MDAKVIAMIGDVDRIGLETILDDPTTYHGMTTHQLRHWVREGYANEAISADAIAAVWERGPKQIIVLRKSADRLAKALRAYMEARENGEESMDPSCPICTDGYAPKELNRGPCIYHQAVAVLREWDAA